jgi:hypothetical protein
MQTPVPKKCSRFQKTFGPHGRPTRDLLHSIRVVVQEVGAGTATVEPHDRGMQSKASEAEQFLGRTTGRGTRRGNVDRGALTAPSLHETPSLGSLRSFVALEICVLPIHCFAQGLGRVSQLMTLSLRPLSARAG